MGADIVIAVNLTVAPFRPEPNQSLVTVLNRSISVMITVKELRSMEMADIVINADLREYTSTDYAEPEKIVAQGYAEAARKSTLLARLGVEGQAWQQYQAARESRRIHSVPTPEFVTVAAVEGPLSRGVEKAFADNVGYRRLPQAGAGHLTRSRAMGVYTDTPRLALFQSLMEQYHYLGYEQHSASISSLAETLGRSLSL
jgi:hypothetical protein